MSKPIPEIKDLSQEQLRELDEKGRTTIDGEVLKKTPYLECIHRDKDGNIKGIS